MRRWRDAPGSLRWAVLIAASACSGGDGNGVVDPTGPGLVAPQILTDSLPVALVGVAYTDTLEASEGDGQYTWSLAAGELPEVLTMSRGGVISGTPDRSGITELSVRVESADL